MKSPILRNILAVLAGILLGSTLNGFIISISGYIIPPPIGANLTTIEGLKASMHLMQPIHFLMPFLAHALGTLVGCWLTAKLALSQKLAMSFIVGTLFLIGSIINILMLPSPILFSIIDASFAYLPMAYAGFKLAK